MYSGSEGDCFNFSSFNDSISFNFGNEDQESFQDTIFQDFSARFRHLGIDSQKVYDLVIKQMEFFETFGDGNALVQMAHLASEAESWQQLLQETNQELSNVKTEFEHYKIEAEAAKAKFHSMMNMAKVHMQNKVEEKMSEMAEEFSQKLAEYTQECERKLKESVAFRVDVESKNKDLERKVADLEKQLSRAKAASRGQTGRVFKTTFESNVGRNFNFKIPTISALQRALESEETNGRQIFKRSSFVTDPDESTCKKLSLNVTKTFENEARVDNLAASNTRPLNFGTGEGQMRTTASNWFDDDDFSLGQKAGHQFFGWQ